MALVELFLSFCLLFDLEFTSLGLRFALATRRGQATGAAREAPKARFGGGRRLRLAGGSGAELPMAAARARRERPLCDVAPDATHRNPCVGDLRLARAGTIKHDARWAVSINESLHARLRRCCPGHNLVSLRLSNCEVDLLRCPYPSRRYLSSFSEGLVLASGPLHRLQGDPQRFLAVILSERGRCKYVWEGQERGKRTACRPDSARKAKLGTKI